MNKILLFIISILFSFNAFAVTDIRFWHMEAPPHRVDRIQTLIDEFNSVLVVTEEKRNNPLLKELIKNPKIQIQSSNISDDFSPIDPLDGKSLFSLSLKLLAIPNFIF